MDGVLGGHTPLVHRAPTPPLIVPVGAAALSASMVLSGTYAQNDGGAQADYGYGGQTPSAEWVYLSMRDPAAYGFASFPGSDNVQFRPVALGSSYGGGIFDTPPIDVNDVSDQFSIDFFDAFATPATEYRIFVVMIASDDGDAFTFDVSHPEIGTMEDDGIIFPSETGILWYSQQGTLSAGGPSPFTIGASGTKVLWQVWQLDNFDNHSFALHFEDNDNGDSTGDGTMDGVSSSTTGDYLGFLCTQGTPAPDPAFASPYTSVTHVRA